MAIVNLVNGLYSIAVISNFLNGKINLSIVSLVILIFTILDENLFSEISNPDILFIVVILSYMKRQYF